MPKIVDHDQRRGELAQAALRVIGRHGLERATTRAVAVECGWSTGVLKHYFRSKDDLLTAALGELERLNLERFDAAPPAATGLEALESAIDVIMAGDRNETRVWIAFVDRASVHPPTAAALRRAFKIWTRRWAELIRCGQSDGSIASTVDADAAAVELHALINGLRIRGFFEPSGVNATATAERLLRGAGQR